MNTKTKHWASITAGILSLAGYASAANQGGEKYTYDVSGNIVEKSIDGKVTKMSFDQSNHLFDKQAAGHSKETISYDAAGRSIAEKDANGQLLRNMSYGYGDKVLEVENQGKKSSFYYNAEGQLVGKNTSGNVSTYGWDDNVLAAEGATAFTNEAHITGGVPMLKSGGDIVISDYLGNTLASGEKRFDSSAYGEGLEEGRFTGKPFVKEFESYVFHHRLYSAKSNRWNVIDPSGFPDGINNSMYVNGDPLLKLDPLGTTWIEYDKFDTPASPIDTPHTTVASGQQNVNEESYYHITYAKASQRLLSQNIPNHGDVRLTSSGIVSGTLTGGVSIFKTVNIGASATVGWTVGVMVIVKPHDPDKSKVEIFRETMKGTRMYRYVGPATTGPNPYNTGASTPGFSLAILGVPSYEQ